MIRNLIIISLLCLPIGFSVTSFSQSTFSKTDWNGVHHVIILDYTASMHGCCPNTQDIWQETIENVCNTIDNLQIENSRISFYLFAQDVKTLSITESGTTKDVFQLQVTQELKENIKTKLRSQESNGRNTYIKPAFKKVINDLLKDNRKIINEYYQNIFLFTDGQDESEMACEEAFKEWCEVKGDNDYASIVSLKTDGIPQEFINCIPNDCIRIPVPGECTSWEYTWIRPSNAKMTFDVQQNAPYKQNWGRQVSDSNPKVNIQITKGPTLVGYENVTCYFVDQKGNKVTQFNSLDHELKLYVDKANLNGGKNGKYKGNFSYSKEILENGETCKKIEISTPNIEFTYDQNGLWIGTLNLSE